MRELLTAIGLAGAYASECEFRLRLGLPLPSTEMFLNSACTAFLKPPQLMRAMQLGVQFCPPPPDVKLGLVGENRGQGDVLLGREQRVGLGAQRVYPFRRNPQ